MLYFAYGSNLNHHQMKKDRCPGAKFITKYNLKGYKLIFSNSNPNRIFGHANIEKKRKSKVLGAIWEITKMHKKTLDGYEGVPTSYQEESIKWNNKNALIYIQNDYVKKKPSSDYLHTIIQGYKDCDLDLNILKKRITFYSLRYEVHW